MRRSVPANTTQRRRRVGPNGRSEVRVQEPPRAEDLIPSQRERRDRIIHVARQLLERAEYEKIQMRDVAEHAEVALGTVYRYFGSKEHLFAAVLVQWSRSLEAAVERHPLSGDPPEQLRDLFMRVLDAFERLPQFFRLMVVIETTPDRFARQDFEAFSQQTRSTFREAVAQLHPDTAEDVLDVVLSVLGGVMRAWSLGVLDLDTARRQLQATIDLLFSGPPKYRRRTRAATA
jgi:AcrR family transcriptional regulator